MKNNQRSGSLFIRELNNSEVLDIQELFTGSYVKKPLPPGGTAELWYQCIMHFLAWCQEDVIPPHIIKKEAQVVERGLSKKYLRLLLDMVEDENSEERPEDQMVRMMGLSSGERAVALSEVLNEPI